MKQLSKTQAYVLKRVESGALLYGSIYPDPYRLRWEAISEIGGGIFESETVRGSTIMVLRRRGLVREAERKPTQPYWREDYEITAGGYVALAEYDE